MEVRAGLLGVLGVDVEIRPWGEGAFVTVREYLLSPNGPHSFAQSLPLMLVLSERHRRLLLEVEEARQGR